LDENNTRHHWISSTTVHRSKSTTLSTVWLGAFSGILNPLKNHAAYRIHIDHVLEEQNENPRSTENGRHSSFISRWCGNKSPSPVCAIHKSGYMVDYESKRRTKSPTPGEHGRCIASLYDDPDPNKEDDSDKSIEQTSRHGKYWK
jgi:hypothetical protein